MKKTLLSILLIICALQGIAQTLSFDSSTPQLVKKQKNDQKVTVKFSLKNPTDTKKYDVSFSVNKSSSAIAGTEYVMTTDTPVSLNKENGFKSILEITIKGETSSEKMHHLMIDASYKDDKDVTQTVQYVIQIYSMNDGGMDEPILSTEETNTLRHLSVDIFAGGTFDYIDKLKLFQSFGFEGIINTNDLFGQKKRLGFFLGASNFQNFSTDSSNTHIRTVRILQDTGKYVDGKSKYRENMFVDHKKLSISQWSYYFNFTYRLNNERSDLADFYLSFRTEVLQTSTKTEFQTDTISSEITSRSLGASPVFQSGKGMLPQKVVDVQTSWYYSLGLPVFINAKDKFKLYVDPNIGLAALNYSSFAPAPDGKSLQKTITGYYKPFTLFKLRLSEQFTGLNITFGGEVRNVFGSYQTTINAYLGARIDLAKWFTKQNN